MVKAPELSGTVFEVFAGLFLLIYTSDDTDVWSKSNIIYEFLLGINKLLLLLIEELEKKEKV